MKNVLKFEIKEEPTIIQELLEITASMDFEDLYVIGKKGDELFFASNVESTLSEAVGYLELLKQNLMDKRS